MTEPGRWPTRAEGWALLCEFTESAALRTHALAVEAAMRAYARRQGADEERWGLAGLLHDFDYERHPSEAEHGFRGAEIVRERGYAEELAAAIVAHSPHTGAPRVTAMEKTLFAVDELAGFLVAVALVRPSRALADVQVSSVKKKMKQKAFAAAVDRGAIRGGAEELGLPLDEHVQATLEALQGIAGELGL